MIWDFYLCLFGILSEKYDENHIRHDVTFSLFGMHVCAKLCKKIFVFKGIINKRYIVESVRLPMKMFMLMAALMRIST